MSKGKKKLKKKKSPLFVSRGKAQEELQKMDRRRAYSGIDEIKMLAGLYADSFIRNAPRLTPDEEFAVRKRHGLMLGGGFTGEEMSFAEVAEEYRVTVDKVTADYHSAIRKLREIATSTTVQLPFPFKNDK